jgi:hypothetical protein
VVPSAVPNVHDYNRAGTAAIDMPCTVQHRKGRLGKESISIRTWEWLRTVKFDRRR